MQQTQQVNLSQYDKHVCHFWQDLSFKKSAVFGSQAHTFL